MLELGVGADIVRGIGTFFWVILAIALLVAFIKPRTTKGKAISVLLVLIGFFGPILPGAIKRYNEQQEAEARYAKAVAVFDERCKGAGEKVYKRVEKVEGVLLMKIRGAEDDGTRRADPLWPDAALPNEYRKDGYIQSFLFWELNTRSPLKKDKILPGRGSLTSYPDETIGRGYRFVDVKQPDGTILRYRLDESERVGDGKLAAEPIKGQHARYAIDFVNDVDVNPEDRKYWVAGTTITVTDTQTGELIAQRISYSFEPGQGSTANFRSPWGFAVTCPSKNEMTHGRTRYFVDQILKPL